MLTLKSTCSLGRSLYLYIIYYPVSKFTIRNCRFSEHSSAWEGCHLPRVDWSIYHWKSPTHARFPMWAYLRAEVAWPRFYISRDWVASGANVKLHLRKRACSPEVMNFQSWDLRFQIFILTTNTVNKEVLMTSQSWFHIVLPLFLGGPCRILA